MPLESPPASYSSASLNVLCNAINRAGAMPSDPYVIALAGGSATGKSTQLARDLEKRFGEDIAFIEQDFMQASVTDPDSLDPTYRWDNPAIYGFDEIRTTLRQLRAGKPVSLPIYDFATRTIVGARELGGQKLIVIDGLYASFGALAAEANLRVYLESALKNRLVRRLFRSRYERYKNADPRRGIESYFDTVLRAHRDFVTTQRSAAHFVFDVPYHFSETLARFPCEPSESPNLVQGELWARIQDLEILLTSSPRPAFTLRHNGRELLHTEISDDAYHRILDTNPEER